MGVAVASKKMALGRSLYNMVFRRTSTLFVTMIVGAVIFERMFEPNTDYLWERMNKGVSRTSNLYNLTTNLKI